MLLAGEQSPVVWDEVFLDTASRTSQLLAKVVLAERGLHPTFTPMPALEGLARAKGTKGALVIGDRGFDVHANHVVDLGREWTHLSGLPMIYALWAARPGVLARRTWPSSPARRTTGSGCGRSSPRRSRRSGAAIRRGTAATSASASATGSGPYELQGLEAFLGKVAEYGFGPTTELRFADDHVRSARTRRPVSLDTALQKGADGERLDHDEAELLDEKAPLLELGLAADLRRRALHPDGVVTYIVSRNVNYTNVCTTACHFCAFYRPRGHGESYVLTRSSWRRRSRRRWPSAASSSSSRAGSTPTSASSGTRTCSAG